MNKAKQFGNGRCHIPLGRERLYRKIAIMMHNRKTRNVTH